MKREEILMLVCAFILGLFVNSIMKSSCIGKLYEGLDLTDHVTEEGGCVEKMHHFHNYSQSGEHHQSDSIKDYLAAINCVPPNSNNLTIGPGS